MLRSLHIKHYKTWNTCRVSVLSSALYPKCPYYLLFYMQTLYYTGVVRVRALAYVYGGQNAREHCSRCSRSGRSGACSWSGAGGACPYQWRWQRHGIEDRIGVSWWGGGVLVLQYAALSSWSHPGPRGSRSSRVARRPRPPHTRGGTPRGLGNVPGNAGVN